MFPRPYGAVYGAAALTLAKEKGTRIAASPFVIWNSGGRIRTSDLRVMSGFRSKTVTVVTTRTYNDRKALRPSACRSHDIPATRVFPLVMYRLMYIFPRSNGRITRLSMRQASAPWCPTTGCGTNSSSKRGTSSAVSFTDRKPRLLCEPLTTRDPAGLPPRARIAQLYYVLHAFHDSGYNSGYMSARCHFPSEGPPKKTFAQLSGAAESN